jgi:sugar/nucleoside kinase (ribokinase family)
LTRADVPHTPTAQSSTYTHTTYPLPPIPQDLVNKPLLASTTFHFLCHPTELLLHVSQLLALRAAHGITSRPFIVWEPTPASCTPANRPQVLKAVREFDVFSPNHTEIANLFAPTPESEFDRKTVLACALHFVNAASLTGTQATVVVRCGEHGCLTLPPSPGWMWMPAFYAPGAKEVVDASGAGSAFLGGYVAGWLESRDAWEASVWGSVAASFSV